ncbi:MAG: hypothetical protein NVSMB65_21380 [Chloroflexota bacterium]
MTAEHGGLPLRIVEDATALARAGADAVVETVRQATAGGRRCHIALAGGSTPRVLYALLAEPPRAEEIPWQEVEVWWGDERCVGPDSPRATTGWLARRS